MLRGGEHAWEWDSKTCVVKSTWVLKETKRKGESVGCCCCCCFHRVTAVETPCFQFPPGYFKQQHVTDFHPHHNTLSAEWLCQGSSPFSGIWPSKASTLLNASSWEHRWTSGWSGWCNAMVTSGGRCFLCNIPCWTCTFFGRLKWKLYIWKGLVLVKIVEWDI